METIKQICYGWIDENESIAAMNILLDRIEQTLKKEKLLSNEIQCIINKFREQKHNNGGEIKI